MTVRTDQRWRAHAWTGGVALLLAVALAVPVWGAIFTDIQGLAAQRAIERLAAKNIMRGSPDGKFSPTGTVTRADLALFLSRALGLLGQGVPLPNFKDTADIPREMQPAVAAMTSLASVSPQKVEVRKGALVYTLMANRSVYSPGDLVLLTFTIENAGKEAVKFEFANSQFYDFIIKDSDGSEVARWSLGRAFLPVDKPLPLAAGQSFEYLTQWKQLDQNDDPVPPGRYEIIAIQTTKSNPTTLTIIFNKGVMLGYADNTFRPKQDVTRAELAAILVKAMGLGEAPPSALNVTDAAEIPQALRGAVAAALDKRLIPALGDRSFRPNQKATRAEVAWALDGLMDAMKRYDFSKGTLRDIRVGTPTLIVIEDDTKSQRTFRVARAYAVYRNNLIADLKDLKAGDSLQFLKQGDVGDVAYIEATSR